MIKHISFDLWNTLIAPNPEYTVARTKYLKTLDASLSEANVKRLYTDVKKRFDTAAEYRGESATTNRITEVLLTHLQMAIPDQHAVDACRWEFVQMFKRHPPIVIPETIEMLKDLRSKGFTLSICSNTNFISGNTLKHCMIDHWEVDWKFRLFSDQHPYSKPHPSFFGMVIEQSGVEAGEILHIGDHPVCDGNANTCGIKTMIINNPKNLTEAIAQRSYK